MWDWLNGPGNDNAGAVQALAAILGIIATITILVLSVVTTRLAIRQARDASQSALDEIRESRTMTDVTRQMVDANREMVQEASVARMNAHLPVLDIDLHDPWGVPTGDEKWREVDVRVTNHGVGPAVFMEIRWYPEMHRSDPGTPPVPQEDRPRICRLIRKPLRNTLGPGESVSVFLQVPWETPGKHARAMASERVMYPELVDEQELAITGQGQMLVTYQDIYNRPGRVARNIELRLRVGGARVDLYSGEGHAYEPPGMKALKYYDPMDLDGEDEEE